MKRLILGFVAILSGRCLADVSITDVTARQRYPWNGKVDISYVVSGCVPTGGGLQTKLGVMAVDQTTHVTNIATVLSGDVSLAEGPHAIVWDMGAQGLSLQTSNMVFHVSCEAGDSLLGYIDWRISSSSITNGGARAYADATAVQYAADAGKTDAEKAQARTNIGAADDNTVSEHSRMLTQVVSNAYGDVAIRGSSYIASYLWYLRANDPIAEKGTIESVSMDYDKKAGESSYALKLGVFSFDHSTTSATVKALYDLDTDSRIVDTNIPVDEGDVIGFLSTNRVILGSGATTNEFNRFTTTYIFSANQPISVGRTYKATDYKNSISVRYSVRSDYDYDFSKTEYGDLNIVLMGDSIVAHAGWTCDGIWNNERDDIGGWGKWFKRSARPKSIYNYAVGGAKWAHTANTEYSLIDDHEVLGDSNVIYNQINRLIKNIDDNGYPVPDLIIISCGVNDSAALIETDEQVDAVFAPYLDATYSNPSATPWTCDMAQYPNQDVTSYTTIAKAMKFDMELILQKFPDVRVVFIKNSPALATTSIPNYARDATRKTHVVERVASLYYAAPVIDAGSECGICRMQEVHSLKQYDERYSKKYYTQKYLRDAVHLTNAGAKRIGRYLANRIRAYLDVKEIGLGR